MEKNAPNDLGWFLKIDAGFKEDLASIRSWENLKLAYESNTIWVTNFDQQQIDSKEVKSMPYKTIFYSKNGKLYPKNSLLPECNQPSLLWTPIERALPIQLPKFNHNYFGIEEQISLQLIQVDEEQEARALLVLIDTLGKYINTAPVVRLKNISWVTINNVEAMLFGTPFLPLNGGAFWIDGNSLIPVGYNFDLHSISHFLYKSICEENNCWIVWNKDSSYFKIEKNIPVKLTAGSFRQTHENITIDA